VAVHIYTQTIHRTIQNKQYTQQLTILELKFIYFKIQFLPRKNIPSLGYEEVNVTCEGRTEAVKRYVGEMQKF